MEQDSNDPVIFCLAPKAVRRQRLFGILSRDIATVGDLRRQIKYRTGVPESEQRYLNAYVDADRLVRLDSKSDNFTVSHERLPNPLRLQAKGNWPVPKSLKGEPEMLKSYLRLKSFDQELQKHYNHQFGTSRYLPAFLVKSQCEQSLTYEETEEEVARAKSKLYHYLLRNEADGLPGQLFLEPLVDMIKSLAEQERPDVMIDSMEGTDAVKLCTLLDTVSRQSPIETARIYLKVCADKSGGTTTTFRDLLRHTKNLTADVWGDQKLIELLESLLRQPEPLQPRKVTNVIKEHQRDGDLWYTRCATTILPYLVTHCGDVPLNSKDEVKRRLINEPEVPSELYIQMREFLMLKLDGLDDNESWVCMDILQNCDTPHVISGGLLMMGMKMYAVTGESSFDLVLMMLQTMQLHKRMSVKPGLISVNKMFCMLSAKHGQMFSVATQLRSFKIMYQNALSKKCVQVVELYEQ